MQNDCSNDASAPTANNRGFENVGAYSSRRGYRTRARDYRWSVRTFVLYVVALWGGAFHSGPASFDLSIKTRAAGISPKMPPLRRNHSGKSESMSLLQPRRSLYTAFRRAIGGVRGLLRHRLVGRRRSDCSLDGPSGYRQPIMRAMCWKW